MTKKHYRDEFYIYRADKGMRFDSEGVNRGTRIVCGNRLPNNIKEVEDICTVY